MPTSNFGAVDNMVANLSGTNVRMAIFSFDISSVPPGPIASAKLRLQDVIGNATQSYQIWGLLDAHETFNESTLTWNTAGFLSGTTINTTKAYGGAALGTFSNVANSVNTLFDVTSGNFLDFINASGDNDVTFVIVDTNSSAPGSGWATKEHTTALKPTLTLVAGGPPVVSAIQDDRAGGPVAQDSLVTYTVTFSGDIDATTVAAGDFGNEGSATVSIGTITEISPGVFTVEITPTSTGTLQFRVNSGAVLADPSGNELDTTSAILDGDVLTVEEGYAGLLAYYPFDTDYGDTSGNGNDGSLVDVGTSGNSGIITNAGDWKFGGGALDLSSDADFVSVPPLTLSASDTDGWSVAFWARNRTVANNSGGMIVGDTSDTRDFIWVDSAAASGGGVRFRNSASANADFGGLGEDANWHHYAVVYEDADGDSAVDDVTLYLDGAIKNTINNFAGDLTINGIGQGYNAAWAAFDGQLDEVYIFDVAINAATVGELFTGTPDATDPTLVSIADDRSGGPVEPGSLVTYTVTFSEDIDASTVDAGDFGNAGTATFTIGGITEVSPGVFEVEITPNSAGTLQLKVLSGAVITDAAGNLLDTTGAIVSATVITVQGGFSPAGVKLLRVVFVAGQSNADGRAATSELPTSPVNLQQPQDDVDFFRRVEGTIFPLTTLRPGLSETGGFGPAITCGRYLADELADGITTRVAIIKYANGGTNLHTQWAGGGDGTSSGDGSEYVRFQQTVTAGLAALASTYPNAAMELLGMVWLQGESDTGTQAVNYQTNLTNFIADVRLTYGADLRFVVIRLSNGQTAVGSSLATIRAAQTAVAAADPLTGLVDSDGFGMKTDNLHFNGLGQQQNGVASAIQLLNLYPFLSPLQIGPGGGGNLSLTVNDAFDGFVYTLKSSDTMQAGDWELEEVNTAVGDTVDFTVTPSGPKRFYRAERSLAP